MKDRYVKKIVVYCERDNTKVLVIYPDESEDEWIYADEIVVRQEWKNDGKTAI